MHLLQIATSLQTPKHPRKLKNINDIFLEIKNLIGFVKEELEMTLVQYVL